MSGVVLLVGQICLAGWRRRCVLPELIGHESGLLRLRPGLGLFCHSGKHAVSILLVWQADNLNVRLCPAGSLVKLGCRVLAVLLRLLQ